MRDGGEVTHGFAEMALEREGPDMQALPPMELGGFEPPTSWVRSIRVVQRESAEKIALSRAF
jgi:hypothetical protein